MYENIGAQNDGICFVFKARVVHNLKNSRKHHIRKIFTEVPLVK
jgi:hypothetical protein